MCSLKNIGTNAPTLDKAEEVQKDQERLITELLLEQDKVTKESSRATILQVDLDIVNMRIRVLEG